MLPKTLQKCYNQEIRASKMSEKKQTSAHQHTPAARLAAKKLASMREQSGFFSAPKKKQETIQKLKVAIKHALFLNDETKKKWLKAADYLETKAADELMNAILRENFRWKKGERKLEFSSDL